MKRTLTLILAGVFVLLCLVGCKGSADDCGVMRMLKDGEIQLEIETSGAEYGGIERMLYAVRDGKAVIAYDFSDGAPAGELLLTADGDFHIDNASGTYSDYTSSDLNYSGYFFKYDQFKFVEKANEGGYTVYRFKRGETTWEFKYSGDELKIINNYMETDGKQFPILNNILVNSVSGSISYGLHFSVPEDYEKTAAQD